MNVSIPLIVTLASLFSALTIGSIVRMVALRRVPDAKSNSKFQSLKTWWGLAGALSLAVIFGPLGVSALLAVAGILSLREYLRLVGSSSVGTPTTILLFANVPLFYLLVLLGFEAELRNVAPLLFVLVFGGVRASLGLTHDFVRITAAMVWGSMLFVFCLSHSLFLFTLAVSAKPWVGDAGWFLFLVLLTETNDIAQALVGRRIGKTKIVPRISPNKSLEGLLGGIVTTMVLSILIAPFLTTWMQDRSWGSGVLLSMLSGLIISLFGFLGDINKSGIKRDVGVKDSSDLLPGQGGMMDRVDSLTFSAPVFYYFVRFVVERN